ncbi:MAG: cation:proton antiporter [Chromatiales bacterium]|nr:cation:proton antiporter [Chromatiales bacterium]
MHEFTLLRDIALGIIFAAALAHIAQRIRQPLLLGYIAAGILLGPNLGLGLVHSEESIELISEIGLILLLFIIGLEIDLRELKRLGKTMFGLAVGQFAVNVGLGLGFFALLGFAWGGGQFDLLYLAVVTSLSSTLIVVKLLRDKYELKLLAGKLTLGVLVMQDVWAILFLALQPNLADPGVLQIAKSIGSGLLLVVAAFAVSRYVLGPLLDATASWPELVLVSVIGWCFAVSGSAEYLGLSREMGALIAGLSIATFPYAADVISKVSGVRDFFVTLFFVALGMKIPVPNADLISTAALIAGFVMLSRLIAVVPVARMLGNEWQPSMVTGLNLAQLSEFSLVIVSLGAAFGHVSEETASLILMAMILTSLISPYIINGNDAIARWLLRPVVGDGVPDDEDAPPSTHAEGPRREVVLLGHFRIAEAVLDIIEKDAPQLKDKVTVVSADTRSGRAIQARGFRWAYADLAHPDALEHLGIAEAKVIITTISDTFLRGTNTRALASQLRRLAPNATLVMTGEEQTDHDELLTAGANQVLVPGRITGERIVEVLHANGYR